MHVRKWGGTRLAAVLVGVMGWAMPACALDRGQSEDVVVPPLYLSPSTTVLPKSTELRRLLIENSAGGAIQGSRDGGKTWTQLGKVVRPIQGGIWLPTVKPYGVLAFNFLRGPSNVFATAVNAVHLRFSDPTGYELPLNPKDPLVTPHGASLLPREIIEDPASTPAHAALTDIPAGTGIFGPDWSPRVGSRIYLGDGQNWRSIPYAQGPDVGTPGRSKLLIVTEKQPNEIEWVEFENTQGGQVLVKREGETEPVRVAKVLQPVRGIGRFVGSELIPRPGVIRANHAGVFCIGTTDAKSDPSSIPPKTDVNEIRGGFQIVPSHHYQDQSMSNGGDHGYVYMVVGPWEDPSNLDRYDRGIDGQYPLFRHGFQAGGGQTYMRFRGDPLWYELNLAIRQGKFKNAQGNVVEHLRGIQKDVFSEVTHIRHVLPN